jgi:hypothetical protein
VADRTLTAKDVPRWRLWAASGALASTLGIIMHEMTWSSSALPFAGFLGLVGGAAVAGSSRRSATAQVFARGVAWAVAAPMAAAVLAILGVDGRVERLPALLAATSAASLWLARPALSTPWARAQFSPTAFRRLFLGGMTSAVAVSVLSAGLAVALLSDSMPERVGLVFAALSLGLFASAMGVARMRGWGVLLGGVTSLAVLVASPVLGPAALVFLAAALPGALLVLPVLLSRWGRDRPDESRALVRVGGAAPRVRVAVTTPRDAAEAEDDEVAGASAPAAGYRVTVPMPRDTM